MFKRNFSETLGNLNSNVGDAIVFDFTFDATAKDDLSFDTLHKFKAEVKVGKSQYLKTYQSSAKTDGKDKIGSDKRISKLKLSMIILLPIFFIVLIIISSFVYYKKVYKKIIIY